MDNKQDGIIQAVKQCLCRNGCSICEYCPYTHVGDGFECREKLRDDIIALLKAQQPRLMTLKEVKASVGRDVWLEFFGLWNKKDILTATTICACGDHSLCTQYASLSYENYGAKYGWRMWTSRPTPEQREAEPWNS